MNLLELLKIKVSFVFTINEGIHEEYGFDKKIDQLKNEEKWKEIEFFQIRLYSQQRCKRLARFIRSK